MAQPVDHNAKYNQLDTSEKKFLYILYVLKESGDITAEQSNCIKSMMGQEDSNIKFLTNLISNIDLENSKYYVKEFISNLETTQKNQADDYSPVTREKINNPTEEEQYSPLGNVLILSLIHI